MSYSSHSNTLPGANVSPRLSCRPGLVEPQIIHNGAQDRGGPMPPSASASKTASCCGDVLPELLQMTQRKSAALLETGNLSSLSRRLRQQPALYPTMCRPRCDLFAAVEVFFVLFFVWSAPTAICNQVNAYGRVFVSRTKPYFAVKPQV